MSEVLHQARRAVLDYGGIVVTLRVSVPKYIVNWNVIWFEMIHPDGFPLAYTDFPHRSVELSTVISSHEIEYGRFTPKRGQTIRDWIMERAINHFYQSNPLQIHLKPAGSVTNHFDGFLGEDFNALFTGLEDIIGPHVPSYSAMERFHWRNFFKRDDPHRDEIESLFVAWRQESKKNK